MYLLSVLFLMLVFPAASVYLDHAFWHPATHPMILVVGTWYVFWAAGVRLFVAGWRQIIQPRFTSETIFGLKGDEPLPIVRELGIANVATGTVGLASLAQPTFTFPIAIVGMIFYGAAGIGHLLQRHRNRHENIAMVSDLVAALIFAAYVGFQLLQLYNSTNA